MTIVIRVLVSSNRACAGHNKDDGRVCPEIKSVDRHGEGYCRFQRRPDDLRHTATVLPVSHYRCSAVRRNRNDDGKQQLQ